jgi:hypothetical protein
LLGVLKWQVALHDENSGSWLIDVKLPTTPCSILSVAKAGMGDLDRVEGVVKLNGYVNSAPDFDHQPEVISGASDLLEQVFGERGKHAHTFIGVSVLPGNIPVEIEMVLLVGNELGYSGQLACITAASSW